MVVLRRLEINCRLVKKETVPSQSCSFSSGWNLASFFFIHRSQWKIWLLKECSKFRLALSCIDPFQSPTYDRKQRQALYFLQVLCRPFTIIHHHSFCPFLKSSHLWIFVLFVGSSKKSRDSYLLLQNFHHFLIFRKSPNILKNISKDHSSHSLQKITKICLTFKTMTSTQFHMLGLVFHIYPHCHLYRMGYLYHNLQCQCQMPCKCLIICHSSSRLHYRPCWWIQCMYKVLL